MEALSIFLDKLFHPVVAVIHSVTFVLAFGEIIPQAVCSRQGLAGGANCVWLVRLLMILCYPISYPIGKLSSWSVIFLLHSEHVAVMAIEASKVSIFRKMLHSLIDE